MTWTNMAIKRQNLPRKDHTIRLNQACVSSEVNDLLNVGQTAQDKNFNTTESQDEVLDGIAQSLDEAERNAEPVSEKLANVANKSWLHKLSDDQLNTKVEKYHRPANCGKVVPKFNEEIWSKLPRTARGKDLKFSRLQIT